MTYDNTKTRKNQGFTFSLENTFFEKPQGGQIDPPPPPAVLGLKNKYFEKI